MDLSDLAEAYTLIFEIIYPKNRIIVDYQDRKDLVLLAVRNRFTGEYLAWEKVIDLAKHYGFNLPHCYNFSSVEQLVKNTAQLDGLTEGYVVEFADGQFFKFKSKRDVELSCMTLGLSFQNVISHLADNTYDQFFAKLPEEFIQQAEDYKQQVLSIFQETTQKAQHAFAQAPKEDRKTFARWAQENHPELRPYLFALWDQQDPSAWIYKHAFKNM